MKFKPGDVVRIKRRAYSADSARITLAYSLHMYVLLEESTDNDMWYVKPLLSEGDEETESLMSHMLEKCDIVDLCLTSMRLQEYISRIAKDAST